MCIKLYQTAFKIVPKVIKMEPWGGMRHHLETTLLQRTPCGTPARSWGAFSTIFRAKWRLHGSQNGVEIVITNCEKRRCYLGLFLESLLSHFGYQNEWLVETFCHSSDDTCEKRENVDFCTALKREAHFRGFRVTKTDNKKIPKANGNPSDFEVRF